MNGSKVEISIVVPAYNEEKRIASTIKLIDEYFQKLAESYEIIVVDDGSKDRTKEIVSELGLPNLRLTSYGKNGGKGYAINHGVKEANGNWILFTDADSSTPIEEFTNFYKQAKKDQIIIGSRYLPNSNITLKQSPARRLGSRMGNLLIRSLILPGIKDTQCGFKFFPNEAAKKIFSKQTIYGWGFDMEILRIAKELGYKIIELPVTWHNDEDSKIQSSKVFTKTLSDLFVIKINSLSGTYSNNEQLKEVRRITKFGLVGVIGTILDFIILNILHVTFGVNLLAAVSIGFTAGATNNYILNSLWSFRQLLTWEKFRSYFFISLVGLILSNIIVYTLTELTSWNHNAAKVIAVIIVFGWNYIMNRQLTFKA